MNEVLTFAKATKLDIRFGLVEVPVQYSWNELRPKYQKWLENVKVYKYNTANLEAHVIVPLMSMYTQIAAETNVPATWIAAINYRESANSLHRYFGNGDPISHTTVHVPKGRGPFKTWKAGCLDALHMMGLVGLTNWTLDWFCYQAERFNGFGYEMHGKASSYVFGGTSVQQRGKYDADGHWNPDLMDSQLGVLPIYFALAKIYPTLAIPLKD